MGKGICRQNQYHGEGDLQAHPVSWGRGIDKGKGISYGPVDIVLHTPTVPQLHKPHSPTESHRGMY